MAAELTGYIALTEHAVTLVTAANGTSFKRRASFLDTGTGDPEHLFRGRVTDAERWRQAESAAMHGRDAMLVEKEGDQILVSLDALAARRCPADQAGGVGVNVKGAFRHRAGQAGRIVQHRHHQVAAAAEGGVAFLEEALVAV